MTPPTTDDLLAAIRAASGQDELTWAAPPEPVSGGFWAQIWRVRLDGDLDGQPLGHELIARVMPDPAVAAREIAIQSHLGLVGYPTPRVHLSGPPGPELDQAWMVMDLAPGGQLLAGLSGSSALANLPGLARALPDRLATHAAALHRLDPAPLADEVGGVDDFLDDLLGRAAQLQRSDLTAVGEHLLTRQPTTWAQGEGDDPLAICHGDLHPFNVLTDHTGDTVLDWSAGRVAHPTYDLAFTRLLLAHPPLEAPAPLRPLISRAGRWLARRFLRTYTQKRGQRVDERQLAWHTELHQLRILIEAAGWSASGEAAERRGHPFLLLAPRAAAELRLATGIDVTVEGR